MKSLAVIVLFILSLVGVAFALSARAQQQLVFVPARTAPRAPSAEGRAARSLIRTIERMRPGTPAHQEALRAVLNRSP